MGFSVSTPPLETRDQEEDKVIMVSDVARAFFEAPARRTICVELLEEETHEGDDVGRLLQSLYGTRDASANFQEEARKVLTKAGFKRGKYNPSTYFHEKVGTKAMVHGDDFISSGSRKSLRWFGQVLESRFVVSTVVVGDGREKEVQDTRVLNRIIRMDHEGWQREADQRHGELIVKALSLQEAKWALPRRVPPKRLDLGVPGRPRRASRLHRFRLGWLQEDSQEYERGAILRRRPSLKTSATQLRRSRASGNGRDEM